MPTCDRCEMGERQRIFSSVSFSTYSQCRIPYCYTGRLLPAGAAYPCRATRKSGVCGQHLRIRRSVQFILAGAVRYNVPRICATRVCRACVELILCVAVRSPTLRIGCERHGRKNPLPFPYFAAVTCRQSAPDPPRERGDSQEGGNRRCLPSCAPAG